MCLTLFRFLGDRQAMRFTHVDASLRDCRRRVAVHEWFRRRDGYAPRTVVRKSDGRIIEWGGLYNDPFDRGRGVECPAAWGQSYVSELVAASMDVADRTLRLPEVAAFAHAGNARTCRVLRKAGFEQVRFVPAMDRLLYRRRRCGRA